MPAPHQSLLVAGLEPRFQAFVIDRVLAWGLFAGAGVAAWWWFFSEGHLVPGLLVIVATVVAVSLVLAVLTGMKGLTPGKYLLGLRVVSNEGGTPIGIARALVRALVVGIGSLPMFGLGLVTLAWTAVEDRGRQRRGWHDHLVGSVVIDVRPLPQVEVVAEEGPRHVVNLTALKLLPVRGGAAPVVPAPPTPDSEPHVPVPWRDHGPTTPPFAPPGPIAWRVTFDTGETFLVEGLGLVGRQPDGRRGESVRHLVALQSADMSISKTHAQFHLAPDGALVVADRGSTNGSLIVRRGVSRRLSADRPATLVDGDRVSFGDRTMTVSRDDL